MQLALPASINPACALAEGLRTGSLLLVIVMTITFFTGCGTTKEADRNTILREPDRGQAVHGEVGAMYGHSG